METVEEERLLLNLRDVAQVTSMSIHWWRAAIKNGEVPPGVRVVRVGRAVRVNYSDLKKWIEGGNDQIATPHKRGPGRPRKSK